MSTLIQERSSVRNELTAWYESALAEQESSGLSVADFAREIGVTPNTLYVWRRRLSSPPSVRRRARGAAAGLVRVRMLADEKASEPASATAPPLIVRIGRDRGIEVPLGFNAAELARLVQVLESC